MIENEKEKIAFILENGKKDLDKNQISLAKDDTMAYLEKFGQIPKATQKKVAEAENDLSIVTGLACQQFLTSEVIDKERKAKTADKDIKASVRVNSPMSGKYDIVIYGHKSYPSAIHNPKDPNSVKDPNAPKIEKYGEVRQVVKSAVGFPKEILETISKNVETKMKKK